MSINANNSVGMAGGTGFAETVGARRGPHANPHDQLRTGIDSIFSHNTHLNTAGGLDYMPGQSSSQIRSQAMLALTNSGTGI